MFREKFKVKFIVEWSWLISDLYREIYFLLNPVTIFRNSKEFSVCWWRSSDYIYLTSSKGLEYHLSIPCDPHDVAKPRKLSTRRG